MIIILYFFEFHSISSVAIVPIGWFYQLLIGLVVIREIQGNFCSEFGAISRF